MPTMTCDACGRDLPPDARFCPGCGTAVAEGVAAPGPVAEADPSPEPAQPAEPTEQTEQAEPAAQAAQATADADRPADPTTDPTTDLTGTDPPDPTGDSAGDSPDPTGTAADSEADPGEEPAPAGGPGRSKTSARTVLGNVLAVAAGGTLGVLAGMAIRQAM